MEDEITEVSKDSQGNNDKKQPKSQPEQEPDQEDKVIASRRRRSIKVVQSLEEPKVEVKVEIQPAKEDSENANLEADDMASRRRKSADENDTPFVEPSKVNDDNKSAESETDEEDKPIASKRRKSNSKVVQDEDDASSEDNKPLASRRRKSVNKPLSPKKGDAANLRRKSKRSLSPKKYNDSSDSRVSITQYRNSRIFLPRRFYVKSNLLHFESLNLPILTVVSALILIAESHKKSKF